MTVEAGAILSDIHAAAEAEGLIFPLTLASQGSARIGGLLATNAGGVNVIRYGNARDLCLGIEAVLPDGSVMHTLSGLRKNNMGYDLRHLMIGAEGTLGVITAATLRLFPKPATTGAALMVVPDPTPRWASCGWRRRGWGRGSRPSRSCTAWASISCARWGRRCAIPSTIRRNGCA
jgi:FAD/FMN-containing dehydrogenase